MSGNSRIPVLSVVSMTAAALVALCLCGLCASVASPAAPAAGAQVRGCPAVTHIRFYPRKGHARQMQRGRFLGSNEGPTTGFDTLAEIKDVPPEGQWTEIRLDKPLRYRFLKYQCPLNGWGNIAELEFRGGQAKLEGKPFGTAGSRGDSGNDFHKALDGDATTFYDAAEPHDQYVGIDLGPAVQAAAPTLRPPPGTYDKPVEVAIACPTPGAAIRVSLNWGTPSRDRGQPYKGPIRIDKGTVLAAVAMTDDLAASPVVLGAYRIGGRADAKTVRTFHVGNSLTDTVDGWLKPVADAAGRKLDFHRFTIPGAPTDWLWNHPGSGFGDTNYAQAFDALAPIDHLFTQPFAGHGRSVDNEAEHSGKFFALCREHSPDVQCWLYVQWPGPKFEDRWSRAQGDDMKALGVKPATTWQEGVDNHVAYTEAVRQRIDDAQEGKPILIVPAGRALALLKTEIDAGRVPGMKDFFAETFADGIHMTAKGRYLISLAHYACIFREDPAGKVPALTTGLTAEQAAIFHRLAWQAVKDYRWAGIAAK